MGGGFSQLVGGWSPKTGGRLVDETLATPLNLVELCNRNRGSSVFKLAYIIVLYYNTHLVYKSRKSINNRSRLLNFSMHWQGLVLVPFSKHGRCKYNIQ